MWFKLDLDGIDMILRIKGYERYSKEPYQWCDTDFSFVNDSWLNYYADNAEVLLPSEIDWLANSLDDLLAGKLKKVNFLDCLEPNYRFILYPKKEFRDNHEPEYLKSIREIEDVYMNLKIYFWNGYLSENNLSLVFYRKNIEYLRNYLFLITGKYKSDDQCILEMIEKGIIINYI